MITLFKLELQKIKISYLFTLIFCVLYSGISIVPFIYGYSYTYNIEIWENSSSLFAMLYPLMAILPTCWLMYYERRDNFLIYTINRVSKRNYILSKWLITSLGGAALIFLVSFIGLIISLYFVKDVKAFDSNRELNCFAAYYFVNKPFIYGFTLSLWRAFIGFLISTFGFVLSLYINNIFIILTGPFIYTIMENFTLSILGIPQYRLVTSFLPTILSGKAISIGSQLVGPILLVLFTIVNIFYFIFIKKEKLYDI